MANQYNAIFNAIVRADAGQAVTELRKVDGQVDKTTGTASSKFSQFGVLAKGAIAGIGAAAAVQFGRTAVDAATDLEESVNAVRVTFKGAADAVLDIGDNSAKSFGLARSEFNSLAVQFAGFATKVAGPGGDVAGVIEDLTTRVADFASVMNLDLATAAQVFQSTLAGETEPIRRYGKDVSAAAVEQFALETGLIRTKAELTESIKVQARYGLLMRDTADTAGDFARTSDSLANQQRVLAARFKDAQAELGQALVPALSEAAEGLTAVLEVADRLRLLDLAAVLGEWAGPLQLIAKVTQYLPGNIKNVSDETLEAFKAARDAGASHDELRKILDLELVPVLYDTTTSWQAYNRWVSDADRTTNKAGDTLVQQAADIGRVERKVRELEAAWRSYTDELLSIQSDSLSVQQAFDDIEQAAVDAYTAGVEGAADAEAKQRDYQQSIIDAKTEVLGLIEQLGRVPASTQAEILTLIDQGEFDLATWKIAELTRAREVQVRFNLQAGALGSAGVRFNQQLGDVLFGVPRGATGGIVTRPTMALIGEAGPEAVIPLNRTPGSSPLPSGGMGAPVFNITVQTGVGDPVQIGRTVVDAVNSYYRTGGSRIAA
jgi:hypothetical protein